MPLYDSGSLGSMEDDFGSGLIIHFPHVLGIVPLLKHTLNKTCEKEMVESLCNTSLGILSKPQASFTSLSTFNVCLFGLLFFFNF